MIASYSRNGKLIFTGGAKMKICPNCNLKYEDKFAFCHHCGGKLQEKIEQNFCPYCGNKVETDGVFCPFCGNSLKETDAVSTDSNYGVSTNSFSTTSDQSSLSKLNIDFIDIKPKQTICKIKDSEEPFFSKHHLFTYDGRRGRKSYLIVNVFWTIIMQLLTFCLTPVVLALGDAGLLFAFIFDVVKAYPMFCNTAKRMHDLNWSTSWAVSFCALALFTQYGLILANPFSLSNSSVLYLKWIIVIILFIPLILLLFKKGTEGPNQYGSDPE